MEALFQLTDSTFPLTIIEHKKENTIHLFDIHAHKNYLQLIYICEGNVRISCGPTSYKMQECSLLLIHPMEFHYGESLCSFVHYYVIRIDLALLAKQSSSICTDKYIKPLLEGYVLFHSLLGEEAKYLVMHCLQRCKAKEFGYELLALTFCYEFLACCYKHSLLQNYSSSKAILLMKKRERFQQVFTYIKEHLIDKITIASLAEMVSLSEASFCRAFRECTGLSPTMYINRCRLEKAIYLFDLGTMNISEVAYASGFSDSNYFSRVFRNYMKQSPSEYIKQNQKLRI